jgi:hypothetical protein
MTNTDKNGFALPEQPVQKDTDEIAERARLSGGAREIHTGRFKGRHVGHMVHYTRYGLPSKYKAERYQEWQRQRNRWGYGYGDWNHRTYWRGHYWDHPRWYHPYWYGYWYGGEDWEGYPGYYYDPNYYYSELYYPSIPYGRSYMGIEGEDEEGYSGGFIDDGIHSEIIR